VTTGKRHGSLSLVLWGVGNENAPGSYRIVATAPDGTPFEAAFEGGRGGPGVVARSFGHDAVAGTWRIEFDRQGPAGLLVELFTYDLERVAMAGR
jgi:hypothetical protein